MCCAADVLEGKGAVQVSITVSELIRFYIPNVKSPIKNALTKANGNASPTKPISPVIVTSP